MSLKERMNLDPLAVRWEDETPVAPEPVAPSDPYVNGVIWLDENGAYLTPPPLSSP